MCSLTKPIWFYCTVLVKYGFWGYDIPFANFLIERKAKKQPKVYHKHFDNSISDAYIDKKISECIGNLWLESLNSMGKYRGKTKKYISKKYIIAKQKDIKPWDDTKW